MWREQAIIEWSRRVISSGACCHSWSFAHLPLEIFDGNTRNILLVFRMPNTYMKMTRDEHVLGFESCDISISWRTWMISFLLNKIWIGIHYFFLNFFATLGLVLGLPVTVRLQVNSGLQPPTRWEPFVAGTMLRRPEPTKETVEPMFLSIIAIAITHLTRFTLLLLLRIQRYMWRNHVATWA